MSHVKTLGPTVLMVASNIRARLDGVPRTSIPQELHTILGEIHRDLDALTKAANAATMELEGRYESDVVAEEEGRSPNADRT